MADASVILTAVGVNMGDHAQDVHNALEVSRETTIQDFVDTVLRLARPIGGESQ